MARGLLVKVSNPEWNEGKAGTNNGMSSRGKRIKNNV